MPHRYIQQPCGFERQLPLSNVKNAGLQDEVWHFFYFMDTTTLHCLLADPSFAACYDHASLNAADSQRLAATPQLAQRQDWQVSRALKQQTDLPTVSLSHSQGFAALLCAPQPLTAGVDIDLSARVISSAVSFGLLAGRTRLFGKQQTGRLKRFTDCGVLKKP